MPLFRLKPPTDRAFRRLGGDPFFGGDCYTLDEHDQTGDRFVSVLLPASVLLGFDDDDAFFGDTLVLESEQAILEIIRKR